jgi:hypothetical protein
VESREELTVKVSYDPKCEELARYFLESEVDTTEREITALAGHIQLAIEDWLNNWEPGGASEPDDVSGQGEEP